MSAFGEPNNLDDDRVLRRLWGKTTAEVTVFHPALYYAPNALRDQEHPHAGGDHRYKQQLTMKHMWCTSRDVEKPTNHNITIKPACRQFFASINEIHACLYSIWCL